jgi:Major Facilitator Superfamily
MNTETIDERPAAQVEHRWWLFTACVLISLTNELSTAVTNLSLGPMRRDLGASSAVMQMAVTLGKLMLGAFMLAGGVAGDVYGRRRVVLLGALGTAVLTSVLTAVARAAYYQRLEPSGLSRQEIAAATEALRRSIQKGAESGGQAIPEAVRTQLADAYRHAFSVGAGGVFACSALICLLCAVYVWFGLKKMGRTVSSSL